MSRKEERILQRLFGPRASYSPWEVELARRAIEIANSDAQRSRLPRRDIRVGEEFEKKGVRYVCVLRPRGYARTASPGDACSGCDILKHSNHCEGPRCSVFDRSDGQDVWFKEV